MAELFSTDKCTCKERNRAGKIGNNERKERNSVIRKSFHCNITVTDREKVNVRVRVTVLVWVRVRVADRTSVKIFS